MGMFDTITFRCPNCDAELSAQSKSGECLLNSYDRHAVPLSVAYDCNRHTPILCDCGKSYSFGFTAVDIREEPKISLPLRDGQTGEIIQ
jgi:hypothetical protein